MGVVHEALDRHLDRHVAIKMIRDASTDPAGRERFFREARAAAAISHPNVCLLHEAAEHEGQPFLVMELLEGEPLSDRLTRGPLPLTEALEVLLPVLSALAALHARAIVHRDLKPSNIFLTPHGVKLLDFGLARHTARDASETVAALTMPGTLSGTPRYMAPEQIVGDPVDARTDIFAAGIVLYELVTGRLPFDGHTSMDLLNAILRHDPLPTGRPELAAIEPIIRRALQRRVDDRYLSADAMAVALRPLVRAAGAHVAAPAPLAPAARIVVLPFRLLKTDEDVSFLESALPEAITTSLAAVPSLCVRSNVAALRFGPSADLARVAEELDVDHVLTGTLLRSGDQIRVTTQLIEMPGGRVRWSQTSQRPLGDLFELQDNISAHIVASLPLDARASNREVPDMPATPRAYELYLRANQYALEARTWATARHLYEQALEEDPRFAPAWARLGRMHRVIGKFFDADYRPSYRAAEDAFQHAFALNPDLSMAHHLYVYLEVETGRAAEALIRLANRVHRQPNQAELYAALCQATRYCGLLEASVAAHHRAGALDPQIATSVANTLLAMQDFPAVLQTAKGGTDSLGALAMFEMGANRDDVMRAVDAEFGGYAKDSQPSVFGDAIRASLSDDREGVLAACQKLIAMSEQHPDGEAIYTVTRMLARAGWRDLALKGFGEAVGAGFFPSAFFERDPWLESVRDSDAYRETLARARERSLAADAAFQAAGGYRLLGVTPSSSGSKP
jgi:TolB-like protein/tRNA A-37 threonylcarbamoyl transferase component Bud32